MQKTIDMRVDYDSESDVFYAYSAKVAKKQIRETIEVADNLNVDIDDNGNIIGLELFEAQEFLAFLNKMFTKKFMSSIDSAQVRVKNYRNYIFITLIFYQNNVRIEEKLPAFSLTQFESPLVAAAN
jgi:uncharacterized protein YuzE